MLLQTVFNKADALFQDPGRNEYTIFLQVGADRRDQAYDDLRKEIRDNDIRFKIDTRQQVPLSDLNDILTVVFLNILFGDQNSFRIDLHSQDR